MIDAPTRLSATPTKPAWLPSRLAVHDHALRISEPSRTAQVVVAGQTFTTAGVRYDRQAVLPINPWKMRVLLTNSQTITDSTKSIVNFDINSGSGAYDTANGFNTTSHQYTVPLFGTWDIAVSLAIGVPSVPNSFQNWQAMLFVNGVQTMTAVERNWLQSAGGNAFNDGTALAGRIALNAGDLVDVRFYPNCGANSSVVQSTSTSQTVWDMHLLSG